MSWPRTVFLWIVFFWTCFGGFLIENPFGYLLRRSNGSFPCWAREGFYGFPNQKASWSSTSALGGKNCFFLR